MINLKQTLYETYFNFSVFSGTAELFIGYSMLQLSLFSISLRHFEINNYRTVSYKRLPNFSFIGFFIFFLSTALLANEDSLSFQGLVTNFHIMLFNDCISLLVKKVICLVVSVFFLSISFTNSNFSLNNSFEYFSFVATSALGSLILCSSGDLITAYLAVELQSIAFYLMACSKKNSSYSIESGLKYFVIGSFSSAFFLLGSSYIYVIFGTLNFTELNVITSLWANANKHYLDLGLVYLSFSFICLSILIKLAVAPFHLWSLDVYESAPTSTTYFFAVVPKLGLFVLLVRIFYSSSFDVFMSSISSYCLIFALLSILVGAFGGIEQRKLKSLLAYSSIGHTGYVLLAFSSGLESSVTLIIYYLSFYMLSSLCFWSVFIFIKQKTCLYKNKFNKELGDLSLLVKSNPMLAIILGTTMFSLAGIPPLLGFLIKFGVFLTAVQSSAYVGTLIGILLTVVSTFYYLRVIKILFFENTMAGKLYHPVRSEKSSIISLLALLLVVLFIKPTYVYLLVFRASLLIF